MVHPRWTAVAASAALVLVMAAGIAACGSGDRGKAAGAPEEEGACPESTQPAPRPRGAGDGVGATIRSGDVSLAITRVFEASAYLMAEDDAHAQAGCTFFEVSATGRNEGGGPLELMCGRRVAATVVTADGIRYGPVPKVGTVLGNPGCGNPIAASGDFAATWIFSVPSDVRVRRFELRDGRAASAGVAVRPE
jgi:hypothetical protein